MFKIEKGVEAPAGTKRRKYPFQDMDIGDSFFIEDASPRHNHQIYAAASYAGSRHGKTFTVRTVEGGYRVWRLA